MRRVFDRTGNLDDEQLLPKPPDEVLTEMTRSRMDRRPRETFSQARQGVLRENPALAKAYADQFI